MYESAYKVLTAPALWLLSYGVRSILHTPYKMQYKLSVPKPKSATTKWIELKLAGTLFSVITSEHAKFHRDPLRGCGGRGADVLPVLLLWEMVLRD